LQATLLGVSIAIILALVAALVGPHFVDWTQYRATFEREATRLAGQPVRIGGAIDVRLLPTPSVQLGRVEIGSAAQPQAKVRGAGAGRADARRGARLGAAHRWAGGLA